MVILYTYVKVTMCYIRFSSFVLWVKNECKDCSLFAHCNSHPTPTFPRLLKKSHKYVIWILICQYLNYLNSFWLILFQILEAYKIPSLQKWFQSKPVKTFQCITHVIFPCLVKRNYITSFTKIKTKKLSYCEYLSLRSNSYNKQTYQREGLSRGVWFLL